MLVSFPTTKTFRLPGWFDRKAEVQVLGFWDGIPSELTGSAKSMVGLKEGSNHVAIQSRKNDVEELHQQPGAPSSRNFAAVGVHNRVNDLAVIIEILGIKLPSATACFAAGDHPQICHLQSSLQQNTPTVN